VGEGRSRPPKAVGRRTREGCVWQAVTFDHDIGVSRPYNQFGKCRINCWRLGVQYLGNPAGQNANPGPV
jgi:hypothetical protein